MIGCTLLILKSKIIPSWVYQTFCFADSCRCVATFSLIEQINRSTLTDLLFTFLIQRVREDMLHFGEHIYEINYQRKWASLVAQSVKNLRAMQETWVQSLGREDPMEESMATHSSILAWRIPRTEEPGRLQPMESWVGHNLATKSPPPKKIPSAEAVLRFRTSLTGMVFYDHPN